ncbi:MAG: protein-L-isoaspartate(D-aspartate) O-methyltransferase [Paracoccaceae bacterium]
MDFAEQRMEFILKMRSQGITDTRVLAAMEATPRDVFLEGVFRARAYEDRPLPIACGQTISQPSVVAKMTEALEITNRCKILEIGTGSGYQAAILSHLARRVYTIERHTGLARAAKALFQRLDMGNITVIAGDGSKGLPAQSPFDRILLTAAAEDPPAPLLAQLRVGGIMILPVGQSDTVQNLIKVVKTDSGMEYTELGEVRFVPLLEGVAKDPAE